MISVAQTVIIRSTNPPPPPPRNSNKERGAGNQTGFKTPLSELSVCLSEWTPRQNSSASLSPFFPWVILYSDLDENGAFDPNWSAHYFSQRWIRSARCPPGHIATISTNSISITNTAAAAAAAAKKQYSLPLSWTPLRIQSGNVVKGLIFHAAKSETDSHYTLCPTEESLPAKNK